MQKYMDTKAQITLREGLDEFRKMVPNFIGAEQYSNPESKALFQGHDAVHVISGLGINITEEAMVDAFTYSSTDLSIWESMKYTKLPEIQNLIRTLPKRDLVIDSIKAIPSAFKVWRASKKMTKKWPFYGWETYLDMSLSDIRDEFNIRPQLYVRRVPK